MCRVKKTRDKRCKCDTSESRQERRKNAAAIINNRPITYKPTPDYSLPPIVRSAFTIAEIKSDIRQLNGIKESARTSLKNDSYSGSGFSFSEYDRLLNKVGDSIENLAETKFGAPTDRQIYEAMTQFTKVEHFKIARVALKEDYSREGAFNKAENKMYSDFGPNIKQVVGALLEKRNEAYRNALISVGVVFADPESLKHSKNSDESALSSIKKALYFFPQVWVDASNDMHSEEKPLTILFNPDERSSYTSGIEENKEWNDDFTQMLHLDKITICQDKRFLVGNDPSLRTALHEFSHRVQHASKDIVLYEKYFLDRRGGLYSTDGVAHEKATLLYPDKEKDEDGYNEVGILDGFPTHYMGKLQGKGDLDKIKGRKAEEILSMGMETLFAGTNGAFVGMFLMKSDPDFKKFMLGLLASTAKSL